MATAEQIKSLIRSHFKNESEHFYTIALQVAAHEAKLGHSSLAHDIRKICIYRDLAGLLMNHIGTIIIIVRRQRVNIRISIMVIGGAFMHFILLLRCVLFVLFSHSRDYFGLDITGGNIKKWDL